MRQVISNLISNSVDAMKTSGGKLFVRTREATSYPAGKRGVLLTVADTGEGMSADTHNKLFRAFFTTKGVSGTGLGLWITKGIVDRHHGLLKVRTSNHPSKSYTVVEVFLPHQGASGLASSTGLSEEETAESLSHKSLMGNVRAYKERV